ncbi:hypothetical protein NL676_013556 [Syzygium grande]|nr:hypothetical protein NL676_013556 [Syzygium grande]
MEKDEHYKIQSTLGSDTRQDVDKALFEMEHLFTIRFHLGEKKSSEGFEFVGGITRKDKDVTSDSVTYKGLITDVKGFGFHLKRMWYDTLKEDSELLIEIKTDEQVSGMLQLASERGSIDLYVEGEADSDLGNSECFEAPGNRRQMKDGRIRHYGSVDGGKTESMENRKDKDSIGKPANLNDIVRLSCQSCEGVEYYERPYIATTEVEDKRDLSSVKRDRAMETDRAPAKRGEGSGTRCASNPRRILQEEAEQGA